MQEIDKILAWVQIAPAGDAEARRARQLGFADFEDALQVASAEACGAAYLVTRDAADLKLSTVTVLSPAEFLTLTAAP